MQDKEGQLRDVKLLQVETQNSTVYRRYMEIYMEIHVWNSEIKKLNHYKFKESLGYVDSSRPDKVMKEDPASKYHHQ